MNTYSLLNAGRVNAGPGSIDSLKEVVADFNARNVLIISDKGVAGAGLIARPQALVEEAGASVSIIDDTPPEPSVEQVESILAAAQGTAWDLVIGIGGGSAMDVAKIVAVMLNNDVKLRDLLNKAPIPRRGIPTVMVPTTAGTGSEVTPISIVTTGATSKTGIVAPILFADVAILDATFTQNLPAHITAATGIDAMVHAIEAYTSKIKKNPYADMLAKQALKLLDHNLSLVLADGHNLPARQNMLVGSMLAGQAFANAPVAAVHALAYPLGGHFHLSHGHTNALVLTEVMKFNAPAAKQHYAELMKWIDPYSTGSTDGLCDLFIDHMQNHLDSSGLTLKLNQLHVPQNTLEQLADDAMLQTRLLQNNPRVLEKADALHIYASMYE